MSREQAKCVMGNAGPGPEENNGNRLMRNLVIARREITATSGHEPQAAVFDFQPPPIQPQQPMPVGMRDARLLEAQPTEQHGYFPLGRKSSMP